MPINGGSPRTEPKGDMGVDIESEWRTNGIIPPTGAPELNHQPEDTVKSCSKIESGLRLGDEAIRACCMGAIVSPMYWSAEEASGISITKEMIIGKRKWLFQLLNDESAHVSCKRCSHVVTKQFKDVRFTGLGHVNLAHFSTCNLRCNFCGFTQHNSFHGARYSALPILREFDRQDVEWDSYVDLNGGEPTLLKDLDEYISYFADRGIRILLYTNAVRYSRSIYDGLLSGAIMWVITSLDAGTPSSFRKVKGRDCFEKVLENITRYSHAGSRGGGMMAVKYIFSNDNRSNDDITGFTYAMLAVRPQKVWLTFDFFPLADKYEGQEEAGVFDYSPHVKAYVKMFLMLRKHGLEPAHFAKTHLAAVVQKGKDLVSSVEGEIEEYVRAHLTEEPALCLKDFRNTDGPESRETKTFSTNPLTLKGSDRSGTPWSLVGKRVALAPACSFTTELLHDPSIRQGTLVGFLDRNKVLHGKSIDTLNICGYEKIPDISPDVILVASPEQHRKDIIQTISRYAGDSVEIAVLVT
jgi:hypothetical protein